ncbi:MAG: hypothetical protein QW103_01880 [Candidatus Pacearchaeota archaeon]
MEIKFDLNIIRYINLLEKIAKVRAKNSFFYNRTLFFVVERKDFLKTIGEKANNIKKLSRALKKKVRILIEPRNNKEKIKFIKEMIKPVKIEEIEIKEKEIEIKAGIEQRAILIGRDRKKEKEMVSVLGPMFGIEKINFVK